MKYTDESRLLAEKYLSYECGYRIEFDADGMVTADVVSYNQGHLGVEDIKVLYKASLLLEEI